MRIRRQRDVRLRITKVVLLGELRLIDGKAFVGIA